MHFTCPVLPTKRVLNVTLTPLLSIFQQEEVLFIGHVDKVTNQIHNFFLADGLFEVWSTPCYDRSMFLIKALIFVGRKKVACQSVIRMRVSEDFMYTQKNRDWIMSVTQPLDLSTQLDITLNYPIGLLRLPFWYKLHSVMSQTWIKEYLIVRREEPSWIIHYDKPISNVIMWRCMTIKRVLKKCKVVIQEWKQNIVKNFAFCKVLKAPCE